MRNLRFDLKVQSMVTRRKNLLLFLVSLCILVIFLLYYFQMPFTQSFGGDFALIYQDPGLHFHIKEYYLPFLWFVFHFFPMYIASYGTWKNHEDYGEKILLDSKTRQIYFLSKYYSSTIMAIISSLSLLLPYFLAIVFLSFHEREWISSFGRIFLFLCLENAVFTGQVFVLSLFLGYRLGLMLHFVYLFIVTLFPKIYLLGQASLLMRQDFIQESGFSAFSEMIVMFVYFFVSFALILFQSSCYDFLSAKE